MNGLDRLLHRSPPPPATGFTGPARAAEFPGVRPWEPKTVEAFGEDLLITYQGFPVLALLGEGNEDYFKLIAGPQVIVDPEPGFNGAWVWIPDLTPGFRQTLRAAGYRGG